MTNKPKNKGTAAETAVLRYVQANGFPDAYRKTLSGNKDGGDIQLNPNTIIEVKNYELPTGFPSEGQVAKWMDELETELRNSGNPVGILVVKRPRRGSPADWFCFHHTELFIVDAWLPPRWSSPIVACSRFGDAIEAIR